MKRTTLIAALAFTALFAIAPASLAQTYRVHEVVLTGTLNPNPTLPSGKIVSVLLTKKLFLSLFGHSDISPSKAELYFDAAGGSFLLANLSGDTVYGTFIKQNTSSNTRAVLTRKESTRFDLFGPATFLGDLFSGSNDLTVASR